MACLGAAQAAEIAFRPIRASAIVRIGFLMVDPLHFKAGMQVIPCRGFSNPMFRGYWLPAIALGLILTSSTYAQTVSHHPSHSHEAGAGHAQPTANVPPSLPITVQDYIKRIASALEAANAKKPSADEQRRADEDLNAQKEMARWAKWMFWVGVAELLLTMLGVFLVWRTLKASWAAANAAENTLNAMKDTAARELRAYVGVTVERQSFPEYGQPMHFKISVKNHGQTPAYNVFQSANAKIFRRPTDISEIYAEWPCATKGAILNPDQKNEVIPAIEGGWNDDIAMKIKEEKAAIFLWGEVRYLDIFDVWHVTRFMRLCYGTKLFSDGTFAYALNEGCNDSN